jgi:hypothetical protein
VPALADELVRLPVDLIVVQGEAVLEIKSMNLPGAGGLRVQRPIRSSPAWPESLARPRPSMTA